MMTKGIDKNTRSGQKHSSSDSDSVCFHSLLMATRRARCAPKANVSASVRLGLTSLAEGNEDAIASMLSVAPTDDLVEKMIDCMGVNGLSAEMLIASYFGQSLLIYRTAFGGSTRAIRAQCQRSLSGSHVSGPSRALSRCPRM